MPLRARICRQYVREGEWLAYAVEFVGADRSIESEQTFRVLHNTLQVCSGEPLGGCYDRLMIASGEQVGSLLQVLLQYCAARVCVRQLHFQPQLDSTRTHQRQR